MKHFSDFSFAKSDQWLDSECNYKGGEPGEPANFQISFGLRRMTRVISVCAFIMFYSSLSFGYGGNDGNNDEWTLHSTVQGVDIYYQISTCNDISTIFLKFSNTTTDDIKIVWEEEFWVSDLHIPSNPSGIKSVTVQAAETVFNDCVTTNANQCSIRLSDVVTVSGVNFDRYNPYNINVSVLDN